MCRHLGLAARFVSGYLIQLTADVKPTGDGAAGPTADFTDLHAWAEVYLPGAGWVGLDATSGLLAGEGHIPLAATADPSSAAPISGEIEPCETTFDFHMKVERVFEPPRVTLPYRDAQWREIEALGRTIDEAAHRRDVRLTMGGEPTFVSTTNRDGDEWNYTALSPEKQAKGEELLKRLRGPLMHHRGSLLHFGQGKWYPGEVLPRWAYGCFWRKDGEPIWKDDKLIAKTGIDYGATHRRAFRPRFCACSPSALGLSPEFVRASYEDVYHYLVQENKLPYNVSALDPQTKNARRRARSSPRSLPHGLDQVVGYTLPVLRERASRAGRGNHLQPLEAAHRPAADAHARHFAHGLSPAARLAALGRAERRRPGRRAGSQTSIANALPVREVTAVCPGEDPGESRRRRYPAVPEGKPDNTSVRTSLCASRAMASCTSSCRPPRSWRITST